MRQVARRNGGYNFRSLVRTGAGAVGAAYRGYKSFNKGRSSRKRSSNTGFLTNQYDVKRQYTRKRMPRRKRKAWVKKVRMVKSIMYKDLASQYQMFRSFLTGALAAGNQGVFSGGLYGENGTPATADDFGISDLYSLDTLAGSFGTLNNWDLRSAVLDIEIVNIGNTAGTAGSLTVDCYEIVCRKSLNSQGTAAVVGPADLFNKGFAMQDKIGTNTVLGSTLPGVVPFQNSNFCQHFKILKKTRILLGVGQATHFMHRDSRKRRYQYDIASRPVCSPGWYHGFMFIVQGVADVGNYATICAYSATVQRYYTYAVNEFNSVQAGYTNI